jgi:hypothetical protein
MQLVTAAISTNDRLNGFDYRIYHRSFQKQELLYLEHTALPDDDPDINAWGRRLIELLSFQVNRDQAKTKSQLAVELIDEMEASDVAPNAYVVDSSLFTPVVIRRIQQTIPKESFRKVTVSVRHKERTR